METTRRFERLSLGENLNGNWSRMQLLQRSHLFRWNNPYLHSRPRREPYECSLPSMTRCLLEDDPTKRVFRGYLFATRFGSKMARDFSPEFHTFRETFLESNVS